MILLIAILVVLISTLILLLLPVQGRTGLETEWDDPAPERSLADMATRTVARPTPA
ncbi:hypothetical protein [Deinococcus yunweiensis]|uniref:hypothetical protein n=1 Tax=Deinococcus yunweiensis TaxID=367282 RepID=UPI00398EA238